MVWNSDAQPPACKAMSSSWVWKFGNRAPLDLEIWQWESGSNYHLHCFPATNFLSPVDWMAWPCAWAGATGVIWCRDLSSVLGRAGCTHQTDPHPCAPYGICRPDPAHEPTLQHLAERLGTAGLEQWLSTFLASRHLP